MFSAVSCGGFVKVPGGQDFHATTGREDEAEARRVGGVDRSLPLRDFADRDGAGLVPAVEMRLCLERVCLLAASHTLPSMLDAGGEAARGWSGGQGRVEGVSIPLQRQVMNGSDRQTDMPADRQTERQIERPKGGGLRRIEGLSIPLRNS